MGEFFIVSTFFSVLSFFFPIFLRLDAFLDVREKKGWFSIGLNGLRVLGGYLQPVSGGIAAHITDKKAFYLPYSKLVDTRKKFEITKGFQIYRFHQVVEIGKSDNPYIVLPAAVFQSVSATIFSVLQTKHPFLSLENNTLLTEESNLRLSFQFTTVFNGLVLTIAFIKKILEAIIQWMEKRKSTASSKRPLNN